MRTVLLAVLLLIPSVCFGLNVSFSGSSLPPKRVSTVLRYTSEITSAGYLVDSSGYGVNLTPNNAPGSSISDIQLSDGNRLTARSFDGTNQSYSMSGSFPASAQVIDGDFTFTMLFRHDGNSYPTRLSGMYIGIIANQTYVYFTGPGTIGAQNTTVLVVGQWYLLQVVRKNNNVAVIINNHEDIVNGMGVDVTGYGTDNALIVVGAYGTTSDWWRGSIAYYALDNVALSREDATKDYERIFGIDPNVTAANFVTVRSTEAHRSLSTGGLAHTRINVPKLEKDGGLLIESTTSNQGWYTEQLNNWTAGGATTPTLNVLAPDGTLTADVQHEDASAANIHGHYFSIPGMIAGNYTYSWYVKRFAAGRDWIELYQSSTGGGTCLTYMNITKRIIGTTTAARTQIEEVGQDWLRISQTCAMTIGDHTTYIVPATADTVNIYDGANQDNFYLWGMQYENNTFPTTYCGPVTSAPPGVCAADNVTITPSVPSLTVHGDSIAAGIAPYLKERFNSVTVAATAGFRSTDAWTSWGTRVVDAHSPVVFLHVGVNDISNSVALATIQSKFTSIAADAAAKNIKLYVDNVGTNNAYTAGMITDLNTLNTWLSTTFAAANPSVTILDFMSWAQGGSGDPKVCVAANFDASCVHPNATGYALWADYIKTQIPQAGYGQRTIPALFSPTGNATKLTVSFDAKCGFSSSVDMGSAKRLLTVGGNYGTAVSANSIYIEIDSGIVYAIFQDSLNNFHYLYSAANPFSFSANWFSVKTVVDFANLANMDLWLNGSNAGMTRSGTSGTASFDTSNSLIRFGQTHTGAITGGCSFKNFRIEPYIF